MDKSFIMNALIIVLLIIVGIILLKFLTQLVIIVIIIGGAYLLYRLYFKNKRKFYVIYSKINQLFFLIYLLGIKFVFSFNEFSFMDLNLNSLVVYNQSGYTG